MSTSIERLIASKLLSIHAVMLRPNEPFTWASGWKSPIYCDNRKTLSHPEVRNILKVTMSEQVITKYPQVEYIAGVATGAIALGTLVADALGLPFVYVRSAPKDHGMENLIEGDLPKGKKVVVIEDLISTGGSSIKAVEALKHHAADVLGMLAIYTHGFPDAEVLFRRANVSFDTLSNYTAVIEEAIRIGYISSDESEVLKVWREDPAHWMQSK